MISNYSTFIQIMAALYLTMSIDSLIYKRFWSPDYKKLVLNKLKIFQKDTSKQLEFNLNDYIDKKQRESEHDARIWGLHFCLFSFILLMFCGYEQDYIQSVILKNFYWGMPLVVYTITMLIATIILFFMKKRCAWVVISSIVISLLTIISIIVCKFCNLQFMCDSSLFMFLSHYVEFFILLLIVVPVFIQLLKLWVVTKGYSYLIGQNFAKELSDYRQALSAVKNNKKENMPESYHEASTAALCAANGSSENEDTKISNEFLGVLIKHIITKMEEPQLTEQIKAAFKSAWDNKEEEIQEPSNVDEAEDADEIPTIESQSTDVIEKYRDLISQYNKMKGVKISKFCMDNNIDENEFKYARKELMKQENDTKNNSHTRLSTK